MKSKLLVTASTFPKWRDDSTPPFVYELCKRLAGDFEIHVLAPFSIGSELFEERDGIFIHRYKYFPSEKLFTDGAIMANLSKNKWFYVQVPFFFIKQLMEIRRIVRQYEIKIIHAHWIIPQGLTAAVYKAFFNKEIKIVVTCHGGDIFGLRSRLFLKIKRWILRKCCGLTVVSNAIKEEICGLGFKGEFPLDVIPMGVDLDQFSPENYDAKIKEREKIEGAFLLFVGRLRELKGVRYLLEAMPKVLAEFPKAKLLIIGEGEDKEALQTLAGELNLSGDNVVFRGALPNATLPKYYATADIFIGPSLSEGFGLVFVEALGSGCAVIASALPTIADIVIDGETGFAVAPKNSAQISEKILTLLKNKALRDRARENGRKHVLARFDWNIIGKKYKEFLQKL